MLFRAGTTCRLLGLGWFMICVACLVCSEPLRVMVRSDTFKRISAFMGGKGLWNEESKSSSPYISDVVLAMLELSSHFYVLCPLHSNRFITIAKPNIFFFVSFKLCHLKPFKCLHTTPGKKILSICAVKSFGAIRGVSTAYNCRPRLATDVSRLCRGTCFMIFV